MEYLPKPNKQKFLKLQPKNDRGENELKWYIYWRGFFDIQFFINYHLSHYLVNDEGKRIKPGKFHKDFLREMHNRKNVVIRFPRNHGKTTNIVFMTIRDICYKQEKGILFIMQKGLGEKTVNKIRVEFENNQSLISIFGRLVPERTKAEQNKSWRADYLMFLNGVDLQVISKGQAIRGARKTKGYIDDPEEDKETKNINRITELRDWIAGTIMPIFTKGNLKITGTVIHNECLVNYIYNKENNFKKISMEAVKNPQFENKDGIRHLVGGETIRPDRLSIKVLNGLLLDMQAVSGNGFDIWKREFLHIPFNDAGERIWKDHHLSNLITPKYFEDQTFQKLRIYRKPQYCIIGVDTAGGRKTGDFSVIVARGLDGELVACWYDRGGPEIIIQVLNVLIERGYYGVIGIEVNNETGGTTITLAQQQRRRNYLYKRTDIDSYTQKKQKKYGRQTNVSTRKTALGEYDVSIRQANDEFGMIKEVDERVKDEMFYFIKNPENGKREASPGAHDDGIMADAICWQMRKQPMLLVNR